ncbi:MAG: hypothetical protein AABM30_04975 [Actinomycetota bacterium]
MSIGRLAIAALVIPAYAVATAVFLVFLVALGIVLGARVVEAVSDYGHSYSMVMTQRCLEARGRTVERRPAGRDWGELEVTFRGGGVSEWTSLWFAPTPQDAKHGEVSDSERSPRRGNVLFNGPRDPAIDECLDRSRRDE